MSVKIYEKLAAIQAALKAPKSQFNSFGNYHYRKAEDILEAVKPLLAQHGCVLTLTDELQLIGDRYYVKATATLGDVESGDFFQTSAFAREEEGKKGMDGSQVTGASSSYARKYALNGLLCIDDTQDSDTTNIGDGTPAAKPAAKTAKKPAKTPVEATQAPAPISTHDKWVKAIATGAVNAQGVKAEDAYKAKYNPTPEEWAQLQDEVYHYKQENGIQS